MHASHSSISNNSRGNASAGEPAHVDNDDNTPSSRSAAVTPDWAEHCFDVAIIGGGPAGSTAGALLAKSGWRVIVFERCTHPRFHIGESLLPMNLPVFEALGVLEGVRQIGVRKPGADFTVAAGGSHLSFPFAKALGPSPDHAFQVTRSEFDALLAANCERAGATFCSNIEVTAASRDGAATTLTCQDSNGAQWTCSGRYLIDASGQATTLARQYGWRRRDPQHAAAAMFRHYRNGQRRDAAEAGNISVYRVPHGWLWMIPLRDNTMSVGAVCDARYMRTRDGDLEAFFTNTVNACAAAGARLADATPVNDVRVAANYSYAATQQTGPGFALIGDAYTFVDPVFSSGVYLAMSSAQNIVPVVESWLDGARLQHRWRAWRYKRRTRRAVNAFKWFIYRFTTPAMGWLFANPRNVLKVEQAVVSMLAGDVYDNRNVRCRLLVFKLIYWCANALGASPESGYKDKPAPDEISEDCQPAQTRRTAR